MPKIIQTSLGRIKGIEKDGCLCYLGIPFAKAPVGKLAFRHPQPQEPWHGVLDATQAKFNAIQPGGPFSVGNTSQDCLYLNVYVPEPYEKDRPVMVWIHGGGYKTGGTGLAREDGDEIAFDMCKFARESGCVVVTFNYRLSLYGFLNLSFLGEEFEVNNGLYDQIAALRFVKENIHHFGGNPDNITVFGQSAGAASILALLSMNEPRTLVNKAIVQSPNTEHFFRPEKAMEYGKMFLRLLGVKDKEELFHLSTKDMLRAVQELEVYSWIKGDIEVPFSPTIDEIDIVKEPKEIVKTLDIPLLAGTTKDEGTAFVYKIPSFLMPMAMKYMHLKPVSDNKDIRYRAADAVTEHVFKRPLVEILEEYPGKAWRYVYNYEAPEAAANGMKSFHAAELPLLFDQNMPFLNVDDPVSKQVGKELRSIFAHFAWYDDPGFEPYFRHKRAYPIDE